MEGFSVGHYLLILCAAFLVVIATLRGYRWYRIHDLPFVALSVASASDGATYSLRVSANMQVGDFLYEFLNLLARGPAREKVQAMRRWYLPILQVRRGDTFIDVDSNLTVSDAGLKDKDFCPVRCVQVENFNRIMYSRVSKEIQSDES
ncbi:MAG: hypothetical protein L6365_06735 [Desulfobulbaceae bacterium]|nr:hypothetical protein [Pseudomonadota bacterium]MCG2747212.1 hypothetical protein [Desulfobulbaceae bacterium]